MNRGDLLNAVPTEKAVTRFSRQYLEAGYKTIILEKFGKVIDSDSNAPCILNILELRFC